MIRAMGAKPLDVITDSAVGQDIPSSYQLGDNVLRVIPPIGICYLWKPKKKNKI